MSGLSKQSLIQIQYRLVSGHYFSMFGLVYYSIVLLFLLVYTPNQYCYPSINLEILVCALKIM